MRTKQKAKKRTGKKFKRINLIGKSVNTRYVKRVKKYVYQYKLKPREPRSRKGK